MIVNVSARVAAGGRASGYAMHAAPATGRTLHSSDTTSMVVVRALIFLGATLGATVKKKKSIQECELEHRTVTTAAVEVSCTRYLVIWTVLRVVEKGNSGNSGNL